MSPRGLENWGDPAAGRRPGRGLIESTQWAVLIPVLLLAVLGIIQAGLLLAGRSAVQQAAMAGAEHAAFVEADAASARLAASGVAERAGLLDVQVAIVDDGTGVDVQVSGRVPTVLPAGWSWVQATAHRVKEQ